MVARDDYFKTETDGQPYRPTLSSAFKLRQAIFHYSKFYF